MSINSIKKITLVSILFICLGSNARAQGNLPYIDDKLIHFGFSIGFNAMDFGITESGSTLDIYDKTKSTSGDIIYTQVGQGVYHVDVSDLSPGFSVGLISDLRLNRYLNLRFTPTLNFARRQLIFNKITTTADSYKETVAIASIPVALPVYLKYSSERVGNYRPYLIGGLGTYFDLSSNDANPYVQLNKVSFYTEFGVGCDIYFPFFKLAPELKFAIGLGKNSDILNHDPTLKDQKDKFYTEALSRLTSRAITLTFNFE